jgi:hypothetical protein
LKSVSVETGSMAEMSAASAPASITESCRMRPAFANATINSQVKQVATSVPPTAKTRIEPIRVKKRSRGSEKPASKIMCGSKTGGRGVNGRGNSTRRGWRNGRRRVSQEVVNEGKGVQHGRPAHARPAGTPRVRAASLEASLR